MRSTIHTFQEAEQFCDTLQSTNGQQKPRSLTRIAQLLKLLGNPQQQLHAIHVTGSYGKSSTAYMIAALLKSRGYTVGLHIKPHLTAITERFCINGEPMPKSVFTNYVKRLTPLVQSMTDKPTYFEFLVVIMILYFTDRHVDIAVIEVGRGGRVDATNIIDTKLLVVTNVFLVHTDILGPTKNDILNEKLGLIRQGIPVVSGIREPALRNIIKKTAQKMQGKAHFVDERTVAERGILPFHGKAKANAALALAAVRSITPIDTTRVRRAWASMHIPGRFERIAYKTNTIYMDAAHNAEKMQFLVQDIRDEFPDSLYTVILRTYADKTLHTYLLALQPIASAFWIATDEPTRIQKHWNDIQTPVHYLSLNAIVKGVAQPSATSFLITGGMTILGQIRTRLSIPYRVK